MRVIFFFCFVCFVHSLDPFFKFTSLHLLFLLLLLILHQFSFIFIIIYPLLFFFYFICCSFPPPPSIGQHLCFITVERLFLFITFFNNNNFYYYYNYILHGLCFLVTIPSKNTARYIREVTIKNNSTCYSTIESFCYFLIRIPILNFPQALI